MIKTIQEIKNILDEFDSNKISYAIIRNYEFLLQNRLYEGKDIDVVVLDKDSKKIATIMAKMEFGRVPINPFSMHTGYAKYISEDEKLLQFHFHINGVTGRHVRYLEAEDILKRRVRRDFFYTSSKEDEFLAILLHCVLDLQSFKDKYRNRLIKLIRENLSESYLESKLGRIFSNKQAEELLNAVYSNNFSKLGKIAPKLKQTFEFRNLLKIIFVIKGGILWKFSRLFKKSPLISFIGMDGTGKTTATNNLKEIFERNRVAYSIIYTGRGRNNILPIQLFGRAYKKIEEKAESRQKVKIGFPLWKKIAYTLAAPVFAADLLIRYWFVIWPQRKTKQVVVTDRYSSDMLLMANVPMLFKKLLYALFPKPTLTIYLWNKPEVLHKRKPDHLLVDLIRQEKIFAEINRKIKPVSVKSGGIEKTIGEVSKLVFREIFR